MIDTLGWTLLHSLWEGVVIWLALRAARVLLAKRSANARYVAGCAALAVAVAAFAATYATIDAATAGPSQGSSYAASPAPAEAHDALVAQAASPEAAPASLRQRELMVASLLPWVVFLWMVGCAWNSVRMAYGWRAARLMATRSHGPVPLRLAVRCRELAQRLGIARAVRIVESARVDGPSIVGWMRPVILVPIGAFAGLDPDQVDGILAHELAHVFRHDFAVNLVQSACDVVFFYHPALRSISRGIREERENACDDIAVRLVGDARGYAAALASLEEARAASVVLAANGAGGLIARVRRLLLGATAPRRGSVTASWLTFAAIATAFALLLAAPGISGRLLAADTAPAVAPASAPASAPAAAPVNPSYPNVVTFLATNPKFGGFGAGDTITVKAIIGDHKHLEPGGTYLVEGTYTLATMDKAVLQVSNQAEGPKAPALPADQQMAVTKGSGKFSLRAKIDGKGPLHVAFNAADTGAAHGIIYVHETGGAPAPRPHEVVVKLLRDTISINGKAVAADQLDAQLAAAHAATPDEAVVIAADQSVPLSTLSNVMDACTKAGMTKVRIHQPAVSVNIDKDSAITVNRSKVPMDGLQAVLALAHKLNPTVAIRIEADQSADIKVLTNVIEATRKAGIGRFELQSR